MPPVGGGLCFLCANISKKIITLTQYESLSICTLECSLPLFNKGWMRQHQGIPIFKNEVRKFCRKRLAVKQCFALAQSNEKHTAGLP